MMLMKESKMEREQKKRIKLLNISKVDEVRIVQEEECGEWWCGDKNLVYLFLFNGTTNSLQLTISSLIALWCETKFNQD
jgi:hypothetical protein